MRSIVRSMILLFVMLLIMPTYVGAAPEKPSGELTVLMTTLGTETMDTARTLAREENAIIFSLGEPLVIGTYRGKAMTRTYISAIATSWKISPDIKTFEFTIRKDATFHDGTPVTIDDVVYSYNRITKSPRAIVTSTTKMIESFEAIGDDRIAFHLKQPSPFFMYKFATFAIHPKAYVEKIGELEFSKKPIYAGPFKFVEQKLGEYVKFEAFEGHYRKVPHYKTLIIRKVPEPSTQLAMLKTGEGDVIFKLQVGPTIKEIEDDPSLKLVSVPLQAELYGAFNNLAKPGNPPSPFWDKRVRHALSYAINRQLIIDKIYYGHGIPSPATCFVPGSPQWNPSVPTVIPYDVEKAKTLLREAGYPNGITINMLFTKREKTAGEAIASMWAKAGIKAKIQIWELGAMAERRRKKTLPDGVTISSHISTPSGMYYYFRKNQLYTCMNDDKLNELTLKMCTFPEGPDQNEFIKNEMCAYIADLMPGIPIVLPRLMHGVRDEIDTEAWEKIGARHVNNIPAAEYIKPK